MATNNYDAYCGTGSGNFPQPGDPDLNNSIINARPAFGGIDVTWSYPELLSEAVAHVRLHRSTNENPDTAVLIRRVSGEFYYDRLNPPSNTVFYYWIEIVSVNGTIGALIGPAIAEAMPTIKQTIEMLTGQISRDHLAQTLRGELQTIDAVNSNLTLETAARLAQYDGLMFDLESYQNNVDEVATLLADEVKRLETSDTAQINQINILGAKTDDNAAQIVTESEARATADEALASQYDVLQASSANTYYQVTAPDPATVSLQEHDIWVDTTKPGDGSEPAYPQYQWDGTQWVETAANTLAGAHAAIEAERLARTNRDGALAQSVETLEASLGKKSRVFFYANPPVAENTNDWWVDPNNNNAVSLWVGDAWVPHPDYTGKVARQTASPQQNTVDDLWFDSGDGDKVYRWDGTDWVPLNLYTGNQVTAAIQENQKSRVGFCLINGEPAASISSRSDCTAREGGTWLDLAAIADVVKGVQITDGTGESASVEQRMQTYKDALGNLNSKYTAKVQTDIEGNKIVGGFGLSVNSGSSDVEAGFDVDRFWVGKLGKKRFPFIIEDGEVFIDEAAINSLTLNKLRSEDNQLAFLPTEYAGDGSIIKNSRLKAQHIDAENLDVRGAATFYGDASSGDTKYIPNVQGWIIKQDGFVEFNNAQIRGNVDLDTLTINGELPSADDSIGTNGKSYSGSLNTSDFSKTLSHSNSTTFDKVPQGGSVSIDYNFSGSINMDLVSAVTEPSEEVHYSKWQRSSLHPYQPDTLPLNPNPNYYSDPPEYGGYYFEEMEARDAGFSTERRRVGYYFDPISSSDITSTIYGTGTLYFRLIANGTVVKEESKSISFSQSLASTVIQEGTTKVRGSVQSNSSHPSVNLNIPLSNVRYVFPEYAYTTEVSVYCYVKVNSIRYSGAPPQRAHFYMTMNEAQANMTMSRL